MRTQNWLPTWLLSSLQEVSSSAEIWLVGGAPRNTFFGFDTNDYDFVVSAGARSVARKLANALGGHYYDLDSERDTGRVILGRDGAREVTLDFARSRGATIEQDLRARDFTINSLAVHVNNLETIVDPTGGLQDVKDKVLRICSPEAIRSDPIRALRAVRLAILFNLSIEPNSLSAIYQDSHQITLCSPERIRDELFRIFALPLPGRALRLLDQLSIMSVLFPELDALRGLAQPLPHEFSAWDHSLSVLDHLGNILLGLGRSHDPELSSELVIGEIVYRLGRYRDGINDHLDSELSHGRKIRQAIYLGALFHDAGKPATYELFDDRIRFIGHERVSSELITSRATQLKLSNSEIKWLQNLVSNHLRPGQLERESRVSRRAKYRFINGTGDAGIEIVLLSLADLLGKRTPPMDQELLSKRVEVARTLLEAYFEVPHTEYYPALLLNGDDIIRYLKIKPGPEIGKILGALKEAQAMQEVNTRAEALEFLRAVYGSMAESDEE